MSDQGKPVIIPTSSGALKGPDWRNDDEEARAARKAAYDANAEKYADLIERAKREKAGE